MFTTLITNVGPRVPQKGPGEGVIYLQISEMCNFDFFKVFSLLAIIISMFQNDPLPPIASEGCLLAYIAYVVFERSPG